MTRVVTLAAAVLEQRNRLPRAGTRSSSFVGILAPPGAVTRPDTCCRGGVTLSAKRTVKDRLFGRDAARAIGIWMSSVRREGRDTAQRAGLAALQEVCEGTL